MKKDKDIYPELFFHSVKFNFDYLIEILDSGYVFARYKSPHKNSDVSFCGNKFISLCKYQDGIDIDTIDYYEDGHILHSGFNNYITNHIGLVFKSIPVLPTIYMPYTELYENPDDSSIIRYSDIGDEYQAYEEISLNDLVAILYPKLFMENYNKVTCNKDYCYLVKYLKEKHYSVPIIDSSKEVILEEVKRLHKSLV